MKTFKTGFNSKQSIHCTTSSLIILKSLYQEKILTMSYTKYNISSSEQGRSPAAIENNSSAKGMATDNNPGKSQTFRLECETCSNYILPPIFQCLNGHLFCDNCCRFYRSICVICNRPLDLVINLDTIQIANADKLPCVNNNCGCENRINNWGKINRINRFDCPYPVGICNWQGNFGSITRHLLDWHQNVTAYFGKSIRFEPMIFSWPNIPCLEVEVGVQYCYGRIFIISIKKADKFDGHQCCFIHIKPIQYLNDCEVFQYKLKLHGNPHRFDWRIIPRLKHEGYAVFYSDCLLNKANDPELIGVNQGLTLEVTIYPC